MKSILKKELIAYFSSINTYIIASLYLIVSGLFLWIMETDYNIFLLGKADLSLFFDLSPFLLCFLMPALSMGVIAEEYSSGTLLWLFAQPIKVIDIVLAKFGALKIVLLFMFMPTLVYVYGIQNLSLSADGFDFGLLFTNYFGLFLLGILFLSVGVFCSSLTKSQLIAYILALFINFLLFFGIKGLATFNLLSENEYWVQRIGLSFHYNNFIKGILDTRSIFYFILLSIVFLLLSSHNISRKKI